MESRRQRSIAGVALLALLACGIQTAAVGAEGSADSSRAASAPKSGDRPSRKMFRFYPGDTVRLVLRDGDRVTAEFVDLVRVPAEEYRDRYDRWRSATESGADMPELGARVQLITGRITGGGRAVFRGLGHEGVEVSKGGGPVRTIEFARFSQLIRRGEKPIESRRMRELSRAGEAPLLTALEVRVGDETRVIPFDDVTGVESLHYPRLIEPSRSVFSGRSSAPKALVSLEAGALVAGDPAGRGVIGHGLVGRFSPRFASPRVGLDTAFGLVRDDDGNGGIQFDLALAGGIPMGPRLGFEPKAGVGILLGGGLGVPSWVVGGGLMARVTRGFGLRADYTYHRLIGTGYNYNSISSVYVGPYWGN